MSVLQKTIVTGVSGTNVTSLWPISNFSLAVPKCTDSLWLSVSNWSILWVFSHKPQDLPQGSGSSGPWWNFSPEMWGQLSNVNGWKLLDNAPDFHLSIGCFWKILSIFLNETLYQQSTWNSLPNKRLHSSSWGRGWTKTIQLHIFSKGFVFKKKSGKSVISITYDTLRFWNVQL